jgi:hypothetical protein
MTFLPLADAPLDSPVPPRTPARPSTPSTPGAGSPSGVRPPVLASPEQAGRRVARFTRRAAGRLVRGLRGRD